MTETMREAVALAIKEARALPGTKPVAKISDVDRRAADAAIRTVLERLREPSEAAIQAGVEAYWPLLEFVEGPLTNGERARRGYLAMLDAAVREALPESADSGRG